MSKTFVYSDPHFYHKNIVTFTNYDGKGRQALDQYEKLKNVY